MYFSTALAISALRVPFLVGAIPVSLNPPRTDGTPISIPLSRRGSHLNDDGFVDPVKLQTNLHHTMARLDRALGAYERNTGEPHPLATSKRGHSNERRFDSVALTNDSLVWMGNINVGTPPRPFPVIFDTLTPDMYIPQVTCDPDICGPGGDPTTFYDTSLSSTAVVLQPMTTVDFGIGSVDGEVVSDSVSVGQYQATQTILTATDIHPAFQFPSFPKGIVGLGFRESSGLNADSFFETVSSGLGPNNGPVIGLFLAESGPELVIGGTDSSKFSGDLTFLDSNQGLWAFDFDSESGAITVCGVDVPFTGQVLLDSGSTFISADATTIANIYRNIEGSAPLENTEVSGQFTVPCNANTIITMTFGGTAFTISPSAYVLGNNEEGSGPLCIGGFAVNNNNNFNEFMIMGNVFLQNVYTELDPVNSKIGFAQAL